MDSIFFFTENTIPCFNAHEINFSIYKGDFFMRFSSLKTAFTRVALLLCVMLSCSSMNAAPSDTIKVVSFNILAPCWADPNIYPAEALPFLDREYRRAKIIQFLNDNQDADVFALQEVTAVEFGFLNNTLSGKYVGFQSFHAPTYWSQYITQTPPWEPNGNALFVKKSTFKNCTFSDVPLSDDGNHATFAQATHASSNKKVRILSVHLDSDYAYNREREFQAALDLMPKSSSKLDIIAGDFNIDITKSNLQKDIDKARFVNVLAAKGITGVTSPYTTKYYANSVFGPIDSVLARNATALDAKIVDFGLMTLYPNKDDENTRVAANFQKCGSDHFPVTGTIQPE